MAYNGLPSIIMGYSGGRMAYNGLPSIIMGYFKGRMAYTGLPSIIMATLGVEWPIMGYLP